MKPILFRIFDYDVSSWSIMVILGVLCLTFLFILRLRKLHTPEKTIDKLLLIGSICGILTYLGASFFDNLWHCIGDATIDGVFHPEMFKYDNQAGGVTFEGGVITGLLSFAIIFLITMKDERKYVFTYMDQLIEGILIAHSLGRVGCFLAGCCYGKPTDSIFGLMYPTDEGWMRVYPTQLFEAIFLFICFIIFFFFIKKNQTEKYFITYGVFRFFLEYLRGDNRGSSPFGFLTPSQFMSLVMIVLGIVVIFLRKHFEAKAIKEYKDKKEHYLTLSTEEQEKNPLPEPVIRYYNPTYKHLFKGIFNNKTCQECQNKLHLAWHSDIKEVNEAELCNEEHLVLQCKSCFKEYEIK